MTNDVFSRRGGFPSLPDTTLPCPYKIHPNAHLSVGTWQCHVQNLFSLEAK